MTDHDAACAETDDTMTEKERLRRRCDELMERCLRLDNELKAARADAEKARKLHGTQSELAYRLGEEKQALLVTIRVLTEELAKWKV